MSESENRFQVVSKQGPSRIWYVTDTEGQYPDWKFAGPSWDENRADARCAAMLLNKGNGWD